MTRTPFDQVLQRLGTDSIKWDKAALALGSSADGGSPDQSGSNLLLPLSLADMDFQTAPVVVAALEARIRHGVFGYTFAGDAYFEAITRWLQRRHAWQVDRDWIVPGTGAVPAINLAIQMLTEPGDAVIVQPPVFHPFAQSVANNGRRVVLNPLRQEAGRYDFDLDDLQRKAQDSRARMLILCSPHNPVGRVWSVSELRELVRVCDAHDMLIVCDEVHCDLTYPWSRFTTLAAAAPECLARLIHCHGPSKTFNLVGLKASTTIIPNPTLRERFVLGLRNLNELFGVGTLATHALRAAYDEGEDWLAQLMSYLEGNMLTLRDYLQVELPQWRMTVPDATYLAWIDCREMGVASSVLKRHLAEHARVVLEDGAMYGAGGDGFLRLNVACPRVTLESALNRIRDALRQRPLQAS